MSFFLLIFISIYSVMHAYLIWKVHGAFPNLGLWRFAVYAFCILMVAMPFIARRTERADITSLTRALTFIGWLWFVAIFWFFCAGILAEAWNLAIRASVLAQPHAKGILLRPRPQLAATVALILIGLVWGFIEISSVRLKTITIKTPRLPPKAKPIRILQLGDTHFGLLLGKRHLQRILPLIEQAAPDIIASTGDMVESPLHQFSETAPLLAAIKPPLGKFACLGNHEFYRGLPDTLTWHQAAGFRILRGESALVGGHLRIVGMDDPAALRGSGQAFLDEDQALGRRPDNRFVLLLKHRPTTRPQSLGNFDLQLSGHTHGGQIFPFMPIVAMSNGVLYGFKELARGSHLYVTRGAGAWGLPIRVLARPEIVLIILQPQSEK